jgi:hypothetical protein
MHPLHSLRILTVGVTISLVGLSPQLLGTPVEPRIKVQNQGVILVPHLLDAARNLVGVDGQVLIYNQGGPALPGERVQLLELRVSLEDVVVEARGLDANLIGDNRFGEVVARIERLPESVTELRRDNFFAPPGAPDFKGAEVTENMRDIKVDLVTLRDEWDNGLEEPFVAVDFRYELDQLFFSDDAPGTVRNIGLEVDYLTAAGQLQTARTSSSVTRLAPLLTAPPTLGRGAIQATFGSSTHVHPGDLHVHSCHGEAIGACAPFGNCGAESFQVTGSFTYSQLKSQYAALGVDWFTATDHSYCMDSANEYNTVVSECNALTTSSFLVIPDTELSSDESGPQQGSDLGDAICLGATSSNHMGAHGISSWKHGGSQEFWGFCDGIFTDELESFGGNINKIRDEGGYPIVHHPAGSSFGWNSVAGLQGIENNDMHGVEIWNGQAVSGQGGDVGMWIDWLEGGRILYGYSGSDTHDEAFAFGTNNVVLEAGESFNTSTVQRAIREGRVYISRDHVLIHEALLLGDPIQMGSLQTLAPIQKAKIVTLEAHYNFGGDTGTITFYGGIDGQQEAAIATSAPLTGQGVFTQTWLPSSINNSWSRAYAQVGGAATYTNPIFYLPGTASSTKFATGLGGANVGDLSSDSAPAIGATVDLDITGLSGASIAVLAASGGQIPGGLPIAGGTLLITLPTVYQATVALDGNGDGKHRVRMPYDTGLVGVQIFWQALGGTAQQPGGIAFTNGLSMVISGLGQ